MNSCELREAIVETTGEQAQAHLHLSHLCEEAMHSPTLDLFLQPPPNTEELKMVLESGSTYHLLHLIPVLLLRL